MSLYDPFSGFLFAPLARSSRIHLYDTLRTLIHISKLFVSIITLMKTGGVRYPTQDFIFSICKIPKKDKYLQPCLERRCHLNTFVFSSDLIPGADAQAATQGMASHLSFNLNRGCYEIFGFVQSRMALLIARSNTLILQGAQDKEVSIRK